MLNMLMAIIFFNYLGANGEADENDYSGING